MGRCRLPEQAVRTPETAHRLLVGPRRLRQQAPVLELVVGSHPITSTHRAPPLRTGRFVANTRPDRATVDRHLSKANFRLHLGRVLIRAPPADVTRSG